jgi:hypothetical protein
MNTAEFTEQRQAQRLANDPPLEQFRGFMADRSTLSGELRHDGMNALSTIDAALETIAKGDQKKLRTEAKRVLENYRICREGPDGFSEKVNEPIEHLRNEARQYLTIVDEYPLRLRELHDKIQYTLERGSRLDEEKQSPLPADRPVQGLALAIWSKIDPLVLPQGWANDFLPRLQHAEGEVEKAMQFELARKG